MNWMPMAKAPRDGTVILVTETPNSEHWNVMPACWMAQGAENINPNTDQGDWWGITPVHWCPSEGPLHARWRPIAITPVCWLPLPDAEPKPKLRRRLSALLAKENSTR